MYLSIHLFIYLSFYISIKCEGGKERTGKLEVGKGREKKEIGDSYKKESGRK